MGAVLGAEVQVVQVHGLGAEEIAADQGDHAGRTAAVLADVDDQGVGVGQQVHRGRGRLAADLGGHEPPQVEIADVPLEPLDLLEPEVRRSARARASAPASRRPSRGSASARGASWASRGAARSE